MVTWTVNRPMTVTTEGGVSKSVDYREGDCLSTDEKPTEGLYNGSVLTEIDTGSIYKFNAAAGTWALTWG